MKGKSILLTAAAIATVQSAWVAYCGWQWGWGPFHMLHDGKTAKLPGNATKFSLENQSALPETILTGKQIIFLGSSVTYGAASKNVSFADYIAVRNGCKSIKEAVSGTTLTDNGPGSYVSRLNRLRVDGKADLFVCQLSTNDASRRMPMGAVSESFHIRDFDTKTTAGAIEYIVAYVRENYGCPVVFYTSPRYDSSAYAELVVLLGKIAEKWHIKIIDMWNDETFCAISDEQRKLYLADPVHPTQAGYLEWWTPLFEQRLSGVLNAPE